MKVEEKIKQIEQTLEVVKANLKELEQEKAGLMKLYTKANEADKKKIEKAMSVSVKKYKKLSEAAVLVSQKVKKLKSQCC